MNTLLAVIGALMLLAFVITTPVTRGREAARRDRRVGRQPARVNLGDVRRRLAAELPAHQVAQVQVAIDRHRLDAQTLWQQLDEHGPRGLAAVLMTDAHR